MLMRAMILAAGRGERLRPLTDSCPKPLVHVLNRPLIEYQLMHLAKAGFKEVVINLSWLGHLLEDKLADGRQFGLTIKYSYEQTALETGGGIQKALPMLSSDGEAFLVVNGDIFIDNLPTKNELALPDKSLAKLFLVPNPEHNPQGDFCLAGSKISMSGENKLTFAGIGVYHPKLFNGCSKQKFPLLDILRPMIDKQLICGQELKSYWCDVGTIDRLQSLEQRLRSANNGKINANLG